MRKGTRIGATLLVAGLAACGDGRAIFNVDVFSFIQDDVSAIPYATLPGPLPPTFEDSSVAERITLLGALGNSTVETVEIIGGADFVNSTGEGDVRFEIYFAADSASTYNAANLKFSLDTLVGPDVKTTQDADTISLIGDPLFEEETIWVGIRLRVNRTSLAALSGEMALSTLKLRIVVRDDVF